MKAIQTRMHSYNRPGSVVFRQTSGAFGGLSNMAAGYPLSVNGIASRTCEALYQACRFPSLPHLQQLILDQASPMAAKMKGKPHRSQTRGDWERVKLPIMRWCLRVKLKQNWPSFSSLLRSTGSLPIVEESQRDDYWGAKPVDDGTLVGQNHLGRLLMDLRSDLLSGELTPLTPVRPPKIDEFLLLGRPIQTLGGRSGFGEGMLFSPAGSKD